MSKKLPESLHAMNDSVHVMMHRSAKKNHGTTSGYVPRERHPSIGFHKSGIESEEAPPTEKTNLSSENPN
jgi:hypothetical protein